MTKMRSDTPICGAASPMPTWCHMVSAMSAISVLISGVTAATGAASSRRMGSPYRRMLSTAI